MGTNFREHLAAARQRSRIWVFLYFFFVILLAAGAGLFTGLVLWVYVAAKGVYRMPDGGTFMFGAGGITLLFVFGVSLGKILELRRGGGAVIAAKMGGRWLPPRSAVREERRLNHVVEEMAVASGGPAPRVFLLDRETGINAFAAGSRRADAVIGFTYGAMAALNREELEGVAGHEMAHVLNGDMELNLKITGALHGLVGLSVLGAEMSDASGSGHDGSAAIIGVPLMVAGSAGAAFARILQAMVNRQREYMADAASVSLTRNPLGFANALKKIGGCERGGALRSGYRLSYAHGFFANPLPSWSRGGLSTHPPLRKRILRLDPGFDGEYPKIGKIELPVDPKVEAERAAREQQQAEGRAQAGTVTRLAGSVAYAAAALSAAERAATHRKRFGKKPEVPSAYKLRTRPNPKHVEYARELIERIPDELHEELHTIPGARLLVFVLLADPDEKKRAAQFADLFDATTCASLIEMHGRVAALGPEARLPLLDLAIPTLRHLERESYMELSRDITRLIRHDKTTQLREWAFARVVRHHLAPLFGLLPRRRTRYYSLAGVRQECLTLVSTFAYAGHDEAEAAGQAFEHAVAYLGFSRPKMLPPLDCGVANLDRALDAVQQVGRAHRHTLLVALAAAVSSDGLVTPDEAELFRAIADCLDHPMPPLLPGQPLL
ncbi:MAG: M48 family metalloprotease [Planctomycetota bacterium]